jgi:hypothetical protein
MSLNLRLPKQPWEMLLLRDRRGINVGERVTSISRREVLLGKLFLKILFVPNGKSISIFFYSENISPFIGFLLPY